MIQRIQTIYLLITIVLTALVIGFPLMNILSDEYIYLVTILGVYANKSMEYSTWVLLAICIVNILVALAAITQFKNRILQMRLATFNMLFTVGFYIALGGYYWILGEKFSANEIVFNWTVILPAINIILTCLAIRAIGKDEALVRATERLR
jgi:uncharacterized membrane protein